MIRRAQRDVETAASVVPAALDLGMLLLEHAQSVSDPDIRKKELAEAEQTLISINSMAEHESRYQLSLGQVYYWEGKTREGRAEFDKVLASVNRAPEMVLRIAELLREVGSTSESRTLAEEGFHAANNERLRKACATLRGLMETDPDVRLDWLSKADPTDPFSRALLSSDAASKALREGDQPKAIEFYKESLRLYKSLPEGPEILNTASIVQELLSSLTGDDDGMDEAATMIERAAAMNPGNSLTLSNAARTRLRIALSDLIGKSFELKTLKMSGNFGLLAHMYDDQAGHDDLLRKVAMHAGIAKALTSFDKVALLSPRQVDPYVQILMIRGFIDDLDGLRSLHRRLEGADLDLADDLKDARESMNGATEDRLRSSWQSGIAEAQERVDRARSKGHAPTLAVALDILSSLRVSGLGLGSTDDREAPVVLAEEAYRLSASNASRHALIVAVMSRAEGRLIAANPDYSKVYELTRRTVSVSERVAALLSVDGPLTQVLSADPDIVRVVELARIDVEKLPKEAGTWDWAVLRHAHPDLAATIAKDYSSRESDRLNREIRERLLPYDCGTALKSFWAHTMAGRADQASLALKKYKANEFPLPIEVPR